MSKQNDDIKNLENKISDLEDQLKRAIADYRNLERRVKEDALSVAAYSRMQLIVKLLPVLDSLDQAVQGASESEAQSGWLKGVLMSVKQLRQVLADEGLVEIDTNGKFDPSLHEAVDIKEGEDGKILQVVVRGYTLDSRVLRAAKVVVGRVSKAGLTEDQTETVKKEVAGNE